MIELLPGERIDSLQIQGLRIIQNSSAPCFSVDAVLLSWFAAPKSGELAVDLGTGTGIVPLLLWGREEGCRVRALELMPQMADMAQRSVQLNNLAAQIEVRCGDLRADLPDEWRSAADIVTMNPPYFALGSGKASGDELRLAARHEYHGTLADWLAAAKRLLKPVGRIAMVHRAERLPDIRRALAKNGLSMQRLLPVAPYPGKAANLVLVQAGFAADAPIEEDTFYIYNAAGSSQDYSPAMAAIYRGGDIDERNSISGSHADR
ncbi:MAG: methyltransferase [Firmicutes bacterium]|nr:methyltransferase [Bacillota bacterium]